MTLREVQLAISAWIRAPEGVARALVEADAAADGAASGAAGRRLARLIRGDAVLDATRRLEIYANAYFHRILDVLSEDFPALRRALGADAFHDLVTSYLLVEPSRHFSLRYAGGRLPGFLATHEAASGIRARSPWAADLAVFEWARADVFDAPDEPALSRSVLSSLAPEAFALLELRLASWARPHSFEHAVDRLWRSATRPGAVEPLDLDALGETTHLLIWRKDELAVHRRLSEREASALARVAAGTRFDRLCEWVATEVGDEAAPAQAAAWLEQWLADGLLASPADASD